MAIIESVFSHTCINTLKAGDSVPNVYSGEATKISVEMNRVENSQWYSDPKIFLRGRWHDGRQSIQQKGTPLQRHGSKVNRTALFVNGEGEVVHDQALLGSFSVYVANTGLRVPTKKLV